MKLVSTKIPDLYIIEPTVFGDERGFFFESYNHKKFEELIGKHVEFVQDNHSCSTKNFLRGLHFQSQPFAQGKLVRCIRGEVYDVAVDIRKGSATFGQWVGVELSAENKRMFWIPEGFAHGFYTRSDVAEFLYKTTNYYSPTHEHGIIWNDPDLNIDWKNTGQPILSQKDLILPTLHDSEVF